MLKELMARIMMKEVIASANTVQKLMKLDPMDKKSRCNYKLMLVTMQAGH